MDKTQRRQEWLGHTMKYRESGLTMKAWCAEHQLPFNQMKYWVRKLSPKSDKRKKANWLPVKPLPAAAEAEQLPAHPLVVQVGGASIEVRPDFDAHLLGQVVRALKAGC